MADTIKLVGPGRAVGIDYPAKRDPGPEFVLFLGIGSRKLTLWVHNYCSTGHQISCATRCACDPLSTHYAMEQ
jgi:hypothetical protein